MKTAQTTHERPAHKGRKLVAAAALTLAAIGHEANQWRTVDALQAENAKKTEQTDRLTSIIASQTGIDEKVIKGESLNKIDSLEAFGQHASPEQREMLTEATVKVGKRQKGTEVWWQSCTGIKITDGTKNYVLSATHCFSDDIVSLGKGGGYDAVNISQASNFEYALLDQSNLSPDGSGTASVPIESVAVSRSADWALIKIGANAPPEFAEKPSIPFELLVNSDSSPVPGEEVALFAYPGHSQGAPVAASGTYIGRIYDPGLSNFGSSLDLVAINPTADSDDACYYGASGSSAVFSSGMVSGRCP